MLQPESLKARETAKCPRCFLDIADHINANKDGYTPYTPAISLLYGLRKALDLLLEEGMENVYARHARLAEGTRRAVKAWGLELCCRDPQKYSNTVSAIVVPQGFDARDVMHYAFHRYNLSLGAACRNWPARCSASAPGRPERAEPVQRHRRRGNGHAGRGHPGNAGQRHRRRQQLLARNRQALGAARLIAPQLR